MEIRSRSKNAGGSTPPIGIESYELPPLLPRNTAGAKRSSPLAAKETRPARVQWRRLGKWTLFYVWLSILVYAIFTLTILSAWRILSQVGACQPDGKFSAFSDTYNWWSGAGFFQITLAFGKLSFAQAKVVDVIWDMVVGRGGQGVIAYISWRVLADYIATSMEKSRPVTYDTFWTVFLHQEASSVGIYRLIWDASFYRALRYKAVVFFAILSLVLTVSFPTLASAMTGYITTTDAYVNDSPGGDGNYLKFSDFQIAAYVIHDAWRIGQTGTFLVPYPTLEKGWDPMLPKSCHDIPSEPCYFPYEQDNGLLKNTSNSFYLSGDRVQHQNSSEIMYMHQQSNKTYDLAYVTQHGTCQPSSDVYQWGFSYIQLFIVTIVLFVWTLGIWMVWLKAHINLPLCEYKDSGEVPRGWKSMLHLASAMQRDLVAADIDPTAMSDSQLRAELRRCVKGGMVSFESDTSSSATTATKGDIHLGRFLWRRTRELKWRVAAFVLYFLATCTVFFFNSQTPIGWALTGITWSSCLAAYEFLFVRRMKWLWLYVPCSCALIGVGCYFLVREYTEMVVWSADGLEY